MRREPTRERQRRPRKASLPSRHGLKGSLLVRYATAAKARSRQFWSRLFLIVQPQAIPNRQDQDRSFGIDPDGRSPRGGPVGRTKLRVLQGRRVKLKRSRNIRRAGAVG